MAEQTARAGHDASAAQAVTTTQAADRAQLLQQMFAAAIAAAQPVRTIAAHLPPPPRGRLVVIGAGKAAAAMAQALEQTWSGPLEGVVVTRYGHAVPCQRIEILEAAHPVPDEAGLRAARRLFDAVTGLTPDDQVLALISGGGSALLPLPAAGLTLADEQQLNQNLLRSGANIGEMNVVRRHLSAIKGGRLAAACHPAPVCNLLVSDVPGDNPIDIASGPTVADPTTCADALAIVQRYRIDLPAAARHLLDNGAGESVKPGDPRLDGVRTVLIATPQMALEAAARIAEAAGYAPRILGDAIEGEAKEVGKVLAAIARQVADRGQPFAPPCVLLSGGETTVTVTGEGRGGRNVECLLAMALALNGHQRIYALAADTDGVDGQVETAGATIAPDSLERAWARGLNPAQCLSSNDGHGFFAALGDAVVTGPTLTNVNDFRAILIDP